jgi:hypothetical protein
LKITLTPLTLDPKPQPEIVKGVPPDTGPLEGTAHCDTLGHVGCPFGEKFTVIERSTEWLFSVIFPFTTAEAGPEEQSTAEADPPWVTIETLGELFCAKTPAVVVKTMVDPSGTGAPLSVAKAPMSVHCPATGLGFVVETWMLKPPEPCGWELGFVGRGWSAEQPVNSATAARPAAARIAFIERRIVPSLDLPIPDFII